MRSIVKNAFYNRRKNLVLSLYKFNVLHILAPEEKGFSAAKNDENSILWIVYLYLLLMISLSFHLRSSIVPKSILFITTWRDKRKSWFILMLCQIHIYSYEMRKILYIWNEKSFQITFSNVHMYRPVIAHMYVTFTELSYLKTDYSYHCNLFSQVPN